MPEGSSRDAITFPRRRKKYPRLPDQINVEFGPGDVIGQAILALYYGAREQGVYLSLSTDLSELVAFNATNPPGWFQLRPMFDADLSGIRANHAFWLRGIDDDDNIVLTHCGRLYALPPSSSLHDELENLRFFYKEPQRQKTPGETCVAESTDLTSVTGRIVFGGAHWIHPRMRGRGLAYFAPRTTRAIGLTTWYTDFAASMAKASMVARGIDATYGWTHVDRGVVTWNRPAAGETLDYKFGWMTRDEVITDLERFTLLLRSGVDRSKVFAI